MADSVERALRWVAIVIVAICALAIPLALVPSVTVYTDANDCFARAFAWHHSAGSTCQPDFSIAEAKVPGLPVIFAMIGVGLGALAIRRWPRPLVALAWTVPAFVLVIVSLAITLDFEIFSFDNRTYSWSASVLGTMFAFLGATAVGLFIAMPIIEIRRVMQRRRDRPEPLARARVVER
jgi:hypothetical protein